MVQRMEKRNVYGGNIVYRGNAVTEEIFFGKSNLLNVQL